MLVWWKLEQKRATTGTHYSPRRSGSALAHYPGGSCQFSSAKHAYAFWLGKTIDLSLEWNYCI